MNTFYNGKRIRVIEKYNDIEGKEMAVVEVLEDVIVGTNLFMENSKVVIPIPAIEERRKD